MGLEKNIKTVTKEILLEEILLKENLIPSNLVSVKN